MSYERIDTSGDFEDVLTSHKFRYQMAAGFIYQVDTVVEFGCGTQYGKYLLPTPPDNYVGIDKQEPANHLADLNTMIWDQPFTVGLSIETLEHLEHPENLVQQLKKAQRLIILSTPIIPTVGHNPFHKQDFTPEQVIAMFEDDTWEPQGWVKQLDIYGFFVFRRKEHYEN